MTAHMHVCYTTLVRDASWTFPVPARRTQYTTPHNVEDASEVLPHNSVIIRRARPRSVSGKMIFRWEGNQFHDGESARLRLEKRRVTRRGTRGWRRVRERGAARGGKWIKFRRMFPFWTRRGIDMARLWNGSFAARLFISVAAASRMLQDGGRSRSRREMLCKIKLLRALRPLHPTSISAGVPIEFM